MKCDEAISGVTQNTTTASRAQICARSERKNALAVEHTLALRKAMKNQVTQNLLRERRFALAGRDVPFLERGLKKRRVAQKVAW